MELEAVRDIIPNPNGLVHTILDAYNVHREFILRPGDVWTSEVVIARSSFFVNARAELLREHIVAHEAYFVLVARQKTDFMPTHIVDSVLMNWIMPQFSTTDAGRNVYDTSMMATMKQYIRWMMKVSSDDLFRLTSGIRRVTLWGGA